MASFVSWLMKKMGVMEVDIDREMTAEKAIKYAPVFYGVRKISTHVGMLPCNLRKRNDRMSEIQTDHPAHKLMKLRPNKYQTPSAFKQMFMTHAVLWGNARAWVYRERGRPVELIPLMPDRTVTALIDGEKWHLSKPSRDERFDLLADIRKNPNDTVSVSDDEVIHLPGFSFDGVSGMSLFDMAEQSFGIGLESEEYAYKQLEKGYAGGLMLEAPVGAFRGSGAEAKEFLEAFRKEHSSADNAGKVGMLRDGIKANVLSMSNLDAQFADQRKFQRQDAALWLMLESILGDDSSVSYNSLEQKLLAYLMNCLGPWLTTLEEELDQKLLTEQENAQGYYFKFNDGALLRSDKLATMQFVNLGLQSKVMTRNEGRAMFDLNPVEGGDEFENPAITPGNSADKQPGDTQAPDKSVSKGTAAKIVENQIRSLLRREARNAINGAKASDFVGWIDKNYTSWEAKLADIFEDLGIDRGMATEHCDASRDMLLTCAEVQPEQLADSVKACVADWENRVFQILNNEVAI